LAKEKGVMPTDLEVAAELKARIDETPDLQKVWMTSGRSQEELTYQIKYEMAQFKVATAGITITDQQVEKHYADNPTRFTTPKQVQLRVVVVDSAGEKQAVDSELAAGKTFAEVATAHSIDAGKTRGGEFGTVPVTAFNPQTGGAINGVKIGQTT